ncbi:MAG: hypothetical protein LBD25_01935 [Coriobacteriales bacterium]|jgi:hypothetical protein|nr:hypothetical protein [Coriobacteriales bacterium]
MKRKVVLTAVIVVTVVALIISVVAASALNGSQVLQRPDSAGYAGLVRVPVMKGEIVHTFSAKGQIASGMPEAYTEIVTYNNVSDKTFRMLKSSGDEFAPDEPVCNYRGSDKALGFHGRIIGADVEKEGSAYTVTIHVLNYDKLWINVLVDAQKLAQINASTEVRYVSASGEHTSRVTRLGYEIVDEKVPVEVALASHDLPGSEVTVTFVLGKALEGLYIPADALYQEADSFYVYVDRSPMASFDPVEGDVPKKRVEVVAGQRFTVKESGLDYQYVEILAGVRESDVLLVETVIGTIVESPDIASGLASG